MDRAFKILKYSLLFIALTLTTQVGGFCLLLALILNRWLYFKKKLNQFLLFIFTYLLVTLLLVPKLAPFFGREKVCTNNQVTATNWLTVLLNRNYVTPQLNTILQKIAIDLKQKDIHISFLDGNFPFTDGFPLFPHLSHKDGKKIDISFIYQNPDGTISNQQKSISGYGVFEEPSPAEFNQIEWCKNRGYFQYDFPKYLTFGEIHKDLIFSEEANKILIQKIVDQPEIEKVFIEPHLKHRLKLNSPKIKYHGCRAVRHDDHIHLQVK